MHYQILVSISQLLNQALYKENCLFDHFWNLNIKYQRSMKLTSVSKSKSKSKGLNRVVTQKKLQVCRNEQKSNGKISSKIQQKNKQNIIHKTSKLKKIKGHITLSESFKHILNIQNEPLKLEPFKDVSNVLSSTHFSNIQTITDQNTQHSYFSEVFINNHKYTVKNSKCYLNTQRKQQNVVNKASMFEKYSRFYDLKDQQSDKLNFQQAQSNQSILKIQLESQSSKRQKTNPNVMASSVGQLMNKKIFKGSNKKVLNSNNDFFGAQNNKNSLDITPLIQKQQQQNQQQPKQRKVKIQIQAPILSLSQKHFPEARLCQTRILSQRTNSLQIQTSQQSQRAALDQRLAQKRVNMHLLKNKSSKILFNFSKENISSNYHSNSLAFQNSLNSEAISQKHDKYKSQAGKDSKNTSLNKIYSNQLKQLGNTSVSSKKTFKNILNQAKKTTTKKKDKQLCKEDFVIGKKIGRGRFGNVYIAQHYQTQSIFAIKILNIQQIKQENMQQQIISQIKLQSFLNHPNILKLYGFFKDQNKIYLILQLADMCLYKFMKQYRSPLQYEKYFQEQKVAYYAKQMLESMKYFHSENIIHRDIKPENIMINFSVLKLGDFGWSVYSPTYKRQTFCGTLDYVPPQIIKGEFYDEKVDIWSFGILLYQLFHGFAPFESQNQIQQQTFQKILQGKINYSQRMSKYLKQLICTILDQNPERRINLYDINESEWMQKHQKQGRLIDQQIWYSWQHLS